MNKVTTIWQRLGALLLAMVLVVGMLPVQAMAGFAIGDGSPLSIELRRRTVGGKYQYYVAFVNNTNVGANDVAYYWCDSMSAAAGKTNDDEIYVAHMIEDSENKLVPDTTVKEHTSSNKDVGVKIVVGGRWLKVAFPEIGYLQRETKNENGEITETYDFYNATWATQSSIDGNVQVGVPFEIKWQYMCQEMQTSIGVTGIDCGGGTPTFADNFGGADVETLDDGRYVLKTKPTGDLTITRTVSGNSTKYGTETLTAAVVDTDITDIKFNNVPASTTGTTYVIGDENSIKLSFKCGIEDAALLPVERKDDSAFTFTWTKPDGVWTATVPAGTYEIGGKEYIVAVDNTTPVISAASAYVDGSNTYVDFTLTPTPASGIKSVVLGTNSATFDAAKDKWVINGVLSGTQTLTVTSNVDKVATKPDVEVIGALAVTVAPNGTHDNGYTATPDLKVTTNRPGKLVFTGENELNVSSDVIITNGVTSYSGKNWTFTDDLGRVANGTLGAYTLDETAPTISVVEQGVAGELTALTGYRSKPTNIVVTVTDLGSGIGAASKVLYYVTGKGEQTLSLATGTATIPLADGDVLTKITVQAVDNMGNKAADHEITGSLTVDAVAPVVDLALSAKTNGTDNTITGCYTDTAGKNWLILSSPVESDAAGTSTEFTVTMTVSDTNLSDMTDWTETDGKWTKAVVTKTVENHKEEQVTLSIPVVKDKAGNYPSELTLPIGADQNGTTQSITLALNAAKDAYEGTVYIDRRYPGSGASGTVPTVTFTTSATEVTTVGGVNLYKEGLKFTVTVEDNGSGVQSNIYAFVLEEDGKINFLDGKYTGSGTDYKTPTIELTTVSGQTGENNALKLKLTVGDNVNNKWHYYHTFAFDNQAPRITFDGMGGYKEASGVYYFNENVTATVTVADLNYNGATIHDNGNDAPLDDQTKTWNKTYNTDGDYTISASATDLAGNETENATPDFGAAFILDTTKPNITVTRTSDDKDVKVVDKIDYYNKPVDYKIEIVEKHLTKGSISYTINGTTTTVQLANMKVREGTVYSHEFTLNDGDRLTDIAFNIVDEATNGYQINPASTQGLFDDSGKYCDGTVVVDTTAPVVTIAKTIAKEDKDPVNTSVDNVELYDEAVAYTIVVTDTNLYSGGISGSYTYTDVKGVAPNPIPAITGTLNAASGKWDGEIAIADGQRFTDASMTVQDAAGNMATLFEAYTDWKIGTDQKIQYTGNDIVVDDTPPAAKLSFQCETDGVTLDGYYTNNGVAYLKLSQPTKTGVKVPDKVKVQATLTITDCNLSTDTNVTNSLKSVENWDMASENPTFINSKTGSVTFTQTLSVGVNKTQAVDLKFLIQDLANNKLTQANASVASINNTNLPAVTEETTGESNNSENEFLKVDEDGNLTGTITLDRRQPTTGKPEVPVIKLTEPSPVATLEDGTPLYKESQTFDLAVNDGSVVKENAGLKSVAWTVNADSFITAVNETNTYSNHTLSMTGQIAVTAGEGEQNDVQITVKAEDNVGNAIDYAKTIAVDTQDPRVTVTCDNDVQPNVDGYFNKDRVATITVTDLNFDEGTTVINAKNGKVSGWTHNGNVHTATVSYTTDGVSSLSMTVKDKAGNTTEDAAVEYKMACHDKFIIDKTLPVIHVNYNPLNESGSYNGVLFYDKEQNVTVTIEEQNFQVKDVYAEFMQGGVPSKHTLSAFTSNGKNHKAHVTFGNGNNYSFSIDFQDMAGNHAVTYKSHSFSVDLNAPEIEILHANVSQEFVQPLAEDLELVLQVTDKERNLANCRLILTHVDNSFEKTEVSGSVYYTREDSEEKGYRATFTFKDFPYEKLYDGVYTVELYAEDHAGNEVRLNPPIRFSMNRFGSTFIYGNEFTEEYLTSEDNGIIYHNSIDGNLVIQEINPNKVYSDANKTAEGSSVTMVVNGQSVLLTKDKDYRLTVEKFGGEGTNWYVYTYEIYREVFEDGKDLVNGRYSIVLYGVDEAGNSNTNTLEAVNGDEVYTAKMEFVLDTIAPVIITTGIESGEIYDATNKQMEIEISDSTPSSIQVYVNGQLVSLSQKAEPLPTDSIWLVQDEITGIYTLNVIEQNTLFSAQDVKIQALDAANNPAEAEVTNFTITTNWFIRLVNSGWLLIVLAILAAMVLLVVFIIKKKKLAAV